MSRTEKAIVFILYLTVAFALMFLGMEWASRL